MMRTWMLCGYLGAALAFAGCGGDAERGESCDDEVKCEEGLDCIPFAIGCVEDCPGTCEKPCESNADCAADEICTPTRGVRFCEKEDFDIN